MYVQVCPWEKYVIQHAWTRVCLMDFQLVADSWTKKGPACFACKYVGVVKLSFYLACPRLHC